MPNEVNNAFHFEFEGAKGVLHLRGKVTVNAAAELHKSLLSAMQTATDIAVDLGEATELDFAGVQLLCAAQMTADRHGTKLSLSGALQAGIAASFQTAGIYPFGEAHNR